MKACKVFCVYFGPKRGAVTNSPNGALSTLRLFREIIDTEFSLDPGVDNLDIVIVHNVFEGDIPEECLSFLNTINGQKTPYGSITVLERTDRVGASLGAYSFAYDHYENDYDYWFFCEDDIKVYHPGYFKLAIDELKADDNLGFLSWTNINYEENPKRRYVSGGFGFSSRDKLRKVKDAFGFLPYDKIESLKVYGKFGDSERLFTNCYVQLGYDIRIPNNKEMIPLADNWMNFWPQRVWQSNKRFDLSGKKFMYHIGL